MAVLNGCKSQKSLEDRNFLDTPVDTEDENEAVRHNSETFPEVISYTAVCRGSHLCLKRPGYWSDCEAATVEQRPATALQGCVVLFIEVSWIAEGKLGPSNKW